ncbi:MAG: ATP-binding protein, partial [Gemmatimonadota bacterium]
DEDRILAQIGRGEFVPAFETMRVRKDGRLVPVSLSVSPVRDSSGRVIGASKVARDISARIRLEADLREAANRKDEFMATLAHELRNPLAPMRHALHLLAALEPESQRVSHVLGILTRQMDHMVRLIDDLLDISRIDRNKLDLRRARVELSALVRQAVETARPLMDAARHTLSVELPEQSILVDVDPVRIAQVLTNLLSNAAKFTNPGGMIAIEARRVGEMLQLQITDNGVGIPVARLESLFEMFVQGHERPEESRGGLGIGLTLVRRIVDLHGGRVYLQSAGLGTGAMAVVELPLETDAPVAAVPQRGIPAASHLRDRRILVVDDIRDNADTLAMLLSVCGADVTTSYDGASALRAFTESPRHVVLLDLGMPTLSGFDVCRALRKLPGGDEAVIVALTGWGQETDRQRSREAGFDAHLVKPVDLPALLELLRQLLAARGVGDPRRPGA